MPESMSLSGNLLTKLFTTLAVGFKVAYKTGCGCDLFFVWQQFHIAPIIDLSGYFSLGPVLLFMYLHTYVWVSV